MSNLDDIKSITWDEFFEQINDLSDRFSTVEIFSDDIPRVSMGDCSDPYAVSEYYIVD